MADARARRALLPRLEDQVLRETGNRYERLLFLSADGMLLWHKDGSREGVELTLQELAYWRGRVDLATHNHPLGLSFTGDDVLTAIMLDVRELNAFSTTLRFWLVRKPGGAWPPLDVAREAVLAIDLAVQSVLAPEVAAGTLSPRLAVAVHRHRRWVLFARRLAAGVDYGVEER